MDFTATVMTKAITMAAHECARLAPFLDDLDGWDGSDCDTGANAALSLDALPGLMHGAPSVRVACDSAAETLLRRGVGHSGILLATVFSSWADHAPDGVLSPVQLRDMLRSTGYASHSSFPFVPALSTILEDAAHELADLGDTVPDSPDLLSRYSSQLQIGLVDATNEATGRIDAGGALLTLLLACMDAALRDDASILHSFTTMLAELAQRGSGAPTPAPPPPGRDFTVDILLEGTPADAHALIERLGGLGARVSYVGRLDLFGMGQWRLHADTSAPLAALPRAGRLIRFQVADARPDDQIGVDELAEEGFTHRGVRLLQRRPVRRVERARVVACTRAPGLVEELARAGAIAFLNPTPEDGAGLLVAATSSVGVAVIAPCDEASAAIAHTVADLVAEPETGVKGVLVVPTRDDLSVLTLAQACAPLFTPQAGSAGAARTTWEVLRSSAHAALTHCASAPLPHGGDQESISAAIAEAGRMGATRWRLLVSRRDDGPYTVASVRQMLATRDASSQVELESWDGGQEGESIVQGIAQ